MLAPARAHRAPLPHIGNLLLRATFRRLDGTSRQPERSGDHCHSEHRRQFLLDQLRLRWRSCSWTQLCASRVARRGQCSSCWPHCYCRVLRDGHWACKPCEDHPRQCADGEARLRAARPDIQPHPGVTATTEVSPRSTADVRGMAAQQRGTRAVYTVLGDRVSVSKSCASRDSHLLLRLCSARRGGNSRVHAAIPVRVTEGGNFMPLVSRAVLWHSTTRSHDPWFMLPACLAPSEIQTNASASATAFRTACMTRGAWTSH